MEFPETTLAPLMVARKWAAGDVLAEKYRLVQELGRGGMGAVWRAEHLVLRSPVAVKLVLSRVADSEPLRARFLREAQAAAALRSPHVVQILDFGVHDDTPFMVMELLEGESLRERLRRVGVLSAPETARIVAHVARALGRAQEAGIVHRDLKPDNVFLVHNADEDVAKVLDFGIAKAVSEGEGVGAATQTGAVLGTPHYMSPEQARGTRAVDHRSDLWALGVISFECLTGRRPFDSAVLGDLLVKICTDPVPVPSSLAPVPAGFDAWFQRALERDPERRFGSAQEMADALRSLVGGVQTSIAPPAPTASIGPTPSSPHSVAVPASTQGAVSVAKPAAPKRSPWVIPLVALLGLGAFAALGAAGYLYLARQEPGPLSSASSLGAPVVVPGVELLNAGDAGDAGAPRTAPRAATAPSAGPAASVAGGDWTDDVKKAQADAKKAQADAKKAQEEAAKARAAAEALKQKLGGQK